MNAIQQSLSTISIFLLCFSNTSLWSQTYQLEYDINAGEEGSISVFTSQVQIEDQLYFIANTEQLGAELYVLTENDLQPVSDINPGVESSNPQSLTEYNDQLFFIANNGEKNGLYMLDENNEVVSLSADINSIDREIIAVKDVGVYFFSGSSVFLFDGDAVAEIEGLSFGYARFDNYDSSNIGIYKDGIALLSAQSGMINLIHVSESEFEVLGSIPFNTTFSDYHSIREFDGGVAFGLFKTNDSDSGLYKYNESSTTITRTTDAFCRRSARINDESAIFLTADGIVLFSTDYPQGAFMDSSLDPVVVSAGGDWMHVSLEDRIIVNSQKTGFFDEGVQVITPNSNTYGETIETDEAYFSKGIRAGDNRVVFCEGNSNGYSPTIVIYDTFSNSFDRYFTFPQSSTVSDFIEPMAVFENRLFFHSPIDATVGREVYSAELDFSLNTSEDHKFNEDWKFKVSGSNSFSVESESNSDIVVQISDISGRRIMSYDTKFNTTIDCSLPSGVSLITVVSGELVNTFKVISF